MMASRSSSAASGSTPAIRSAAAVSFPRRTAPQGCRPACPAGGQQAADHGLADAKAAGHVGGGAPAGQHLVGHRRPGESFGGRLPFVERPLLQTARVRSARARLGRCVPPDLHQPQDDHDVTHAQAREQPAQCCLPARYPRHRAAPRRPGCILPRPAPGAICRHRRLHRGGPRDSRSAWRGPPPDLPHRTSAAAAQGRAPSLSSASTPARLNRETTLDGMRSPCISRGCETPINEAGRQCYMPCVKPSRTMATFEGLPAVQFGVLRC